MTANAHSAFKKNAFQKDGRNSGEAGLRMSRFIDSVIAEVEEAGIDEEYAADDSPSTSARLTPSSSLRPRRRRSA